MTQSKPKFCNFSYFLRIKAWISAEASAAGARLDDFLPPPGRLSAQSVGDLALPTGCQRAGQINMCWGNRRCVAPSPFVCSGANLLPRVPARICIIMGLREPPRSPRWVLPPYPVIAPPLNPPSRSSSFATFIFWASPSSLYPYLNLFTPALFHLIHPLTLIITLCIVGIWLSVWNYKLGSGRNALLKSTFGSPGGAKRRFRAAQL